MRVSITTCVNPGIGGHRPVAAAVSALLPLRLTRAGRA